MTVTITILTDTVAEVIDDKGRHKRPVAAGSVIATNKTDARYLVDVGKAIYGGSTPDTSPPPAKTRTRKTKP